MMKLIERNVERFVVRPQCKEFSMDELWTIFRTLNGAEFSGLWSLAWLGCRLGELVRLTLSDINKLGPDEYSVKFQTTGMGARTRALYMDEFTNGHLKNFIKSGRGCKFLQTACTKLQDKVGVGFTPQWFRSTFCTKMQRRLHEVGVPMAKVNLIIKAMVGHTVDSDTTGIYTDFGKNIKKVMTELHFLKPLEKRTQNKFNEPNNRAIPKQMGGLIEKWGR